MLEKLSDIKFVIVGYVLAMALGLESLIWGRESVLSAAGGLLALFLVCNMIYHAGMKTRSRGEFLVILAVIMGTAIVSTATAYLCRSAEIASNIAVLFMFPMNLPFHMVADSLFETTQNPFFVTLLCLPYLMIFAAGAVGVSKNR